MLISWMAVLVAVMVLLILNRVDRKLDALSEQGARRGEEKFGVPFDDLRPPPALETAVDAGSGRYLDDLAGDKRGDCQCPCCRQVEMGESGEPYGAEEKDGQRGGDGGDESAAKTRGKGIEAADQPSS